MGIAITWLTNIKDMPNFNKGAVQNGIDSVTKRKVYWTDNNLVTCKKHGAMLCVSEDTRIWRCPTCNEGGYISGRWKGTIVLQNKKWYEFWK